MTDAWEWDDERIPPASQLYRHVPHEPDPVSPKSKYDPHTKTWSLTAAAFTRHEMTDDGWSIYRDELLYADDRTVEDIEASKPGETREVWKVTAADVRSCPDSRAGVIDREDPADSVLGKSHGLVRCETEKPARKQIVDLRNWLIARAKQIRERGPT